jgi:hypothetical protein
MKTPKFTFFLWFMFMGSLYSKDQREISYSPLEATFKQAKGTFMVLQDYYFEQKAACEHEHHYLLP